MRVAIIAFRGDSYYLSSLCQGLSELSTVFVICPKNLIDSHICTNARLIELPTTNSVGLKSASINIDPSLVRTVQALVKKTKADVVHVAFETAFLALWGWVLHKFRPLISTIHEPEPFLLFFSPSMIRPMNTAVASNNNKLLVQWSDRVIVHGTHHKSVLINRGVNGKKIKVIPHGDQSFLDWWKTPNSPQSIRPNILFLGRIWPYKGVEYFLQAASIAERVNPNVTFTIAGEGDFGPYEIFARKVKNLNLINKFLNEREIADLLQNTSVVVFPNVSGSQTGWITSAYAFKKPVIVTDTGNFSEMVIDGETGLIVPPCNVNALCRAILKLLSSPLVCQEMGCHGYEFMRKETSWKVVAQKTISVYEDAINERYKR
jgi:glycosyltransferase involved in cell wall biosynthesis